MTTALASPVQSARAEQSSRGTDVCWRVSMSQALDLSAPSGLASTVQGWLPRDRVPAEGRKPAMLIALSSREYSTHQAGMRPHTLSLGPTRAWLDHDSSRVVVESSVCLGWLDLRWRIAEIRVVRDPAPESLRAIHTALTLSAALLLARHGAVLMHAAAVVAPDGRAWLVVGDSRTGKSSVCATLIAAGWNYCADDQVIVYRERGGTQLRVEGWRRVFHLDSGWKRGAPTGLRAPVDPDSLGDGVWQRSAMLAGTIFTSVDPRLPTVLRALPSATAMHLLVRQSPWFLVDPACATACLGILGDIAVSPTRRLRSGLDTFGNSSRLLRTLGYDRATLRLCAPPSSRAAPCAFSE